MKRLIAHIILATIIIGSSGCQYDDKSVIPSYLAAKNIPDWDEVYPLLIVSAQKWDPDAGLRLAILETNSINHPEKHSIGAFFETPNKSFEFLYLEYFDHGKLTTEIFTHGVPITNYDLIAGNAWTLNSTDAWDLFLQDPDVVSFDSKFFDCATLTLINKRLEDEKHKRVLWQLATDDCAQGGSTLFFVDANTGELLGKESH